MNKRRFSIFLALLMLLCAVLPVLSGCSGDDSLPRLDFRGDISNMTTKEDIRNITVEYTDGKNSFTGYAELKVQGTSSLRYEKKNYTIKLFWDEAHEKKLKVDLGWGEESKYCLKANWIDKTHARNVITANLVTQVQQAYGVLEQAPANCAVDGFPIEIYINGEFLGLYTCNIPKDEWMFAMDGDNPDHIVVCGETWDNSVVFNAPANFESWSVEVGEANDETLAKLDRLVDFIMYSSDEEFRTHFEEYMNLDAALHYYIIADYAYLADNLGKNTLLGTYDGLVWYPMLYDLDTSWGTSWDGLEVWDYESESLNMAKNNLWARLETCFGAELAERYFELRESILTKEHIMEMFRTFEASIPEESFLREAQRWGNSIPGFGLDQIEAYLAYSESRLDEKYTQLKNG